ncbi:MAG: GNAT family N-acetyltransferase [Nitrospinae bacterium]|nr:GNAT family N-acetyltransferase [Nitrospinota bacterium]
MAERPVPGLHVVDLGAVKPAELEDLWEQEVRVWRDRLLWDISGPLASLRHIIARGGLPGKAVRVGAQTVGYAYYVVAGHLGVLSGLVVSPAWSTTRVGGTLLKETIEEIRRKGVPRIESQFVSPDCPWLISSFEHEGFRSYWREFLRLDLHRDRGPASPPAIVDLQPWRGTRLREAAAIMHAAYEGEVDTEINECYRTADGCRLVLEDLLNQCGCGMPVLEASAMACDRGRGIGFVVVTETAPRQGHIAQVAVLPQYQRRGVGRFLLSYSVSRLAALHFDTLSLIVSRSNPRALRMYQAMGFQSVLSFPVFAWEGEGKW